MSKFIIYSGTDGRVWRDLDQYIIEDDGTIFGGINGVNTLRYPPSVNPEIIEITDEEFASLDKFLGKYLIQDDKIVADPDWKPYDPEDDVPYGE